MKKENKKMAQQRRAAERQRQERNRKIKSVAVYLIPAVLIILLLGWIIVDAVKEKKSEAEDTEVTLEVDSTVEEEDVEESGITLITDTNAKVADGDTVNIDYVGYIDGEPFEGGDTQGMGTDLEIGSGSYIDDFEEQLIGHNVGETVNVVADFPENYGNMDLRGKEAEFVVTINGIYQ